MTFSITEFKDNLDAKQTGVKIPLNGDGSAFVLIASSDTDEYLSALNRAKAQHVAEIRNPKPDELRLAVAEAFADVIIKGWEGLDDEKGEPLAYTRENVIRLMTVTEYRRFASFVMGEASEWRNFRWRDTEADEKKS